MIVPFPLSQSDHQMQRVRSCVEQHRNAPFRSADWLAGELMKICETAPDNDTQPATSQEGEVAKYADMDIAERATAMADDCVGDPWELLGFFREKLRQSEANAEAAKAAAIGFAQRLAATPTPPTLSEDSIAAFGAVMFGHIWESFTDDRWDIEINDLVTVDAVKAGLVSVAPYDPEVHNDQSGAAEVGDDFYEITPAGRAALAQVKAS